MSPRPIYHIHVEDFIDHVEWFVDRDDYEVASGRVAVIQPDQLGGGAALHVRLAYAFGAAWHQANKERARRLLKDIEGVQEEDRAGRDLDAAMSELARDQAEEAIQ